MNVRQIIRKNTRQNQQVIVRFLRDNYLLKGTTISTQSKNQICLFCSASNNITAEHVLPRWAFKKDSGKFFNSVINGLSHKYNQTTISCCNICNNNLLSSLEQDIIQLLSLFKSQEFIIDEDKEDIIRWLEILNYKYQVFSLQTKFRALKGKGAIDFLSEYPLSVLDPNIKYSPNKVLSNIREALERISFKSKKERCNSLVVFKTKNVDMHFFHRNNDFIFLELPKFKIGLFYFLKQKFKSEVEAKDAALQVIKQHY